VRALESVRGNVRRIVLKGKSVTKGEVEINLEVRLKSENTDFVNQVSDLEGVKSCVLVTYNGDYMG
jgi:hypothetical protein